MYPTLIKSESFLSNSSPSALSTASAMARNPSDRYHTVRNESIEQKQKRKNAIFERNLEQKLLGTERRPGMGMQREGKRTKNRVLSGLQGGREKGGR